MILYSLIKPWLSKDPSEIWSPISMIAFTLLYYVVKPSFGDLSMYGANLASNQYLFYLTAVVFYGCILYAFSRPTKKEFSKWNSYFNIENSTRLGFVLFLIAMVCYVPFRGLRTSISADDATIVTARTGLVSYFIDLISLFVGACCLAYVGLKNKAGMGIKERAAALIIIYFTMVLFIVGGFRYRIVILALALATTYHLYPKPRKINYALLIPLAVVLYLGFAVMDVSRRYGTGIDMDIAKNVTLQDATKGAGESADVLCFSIVTTDNYSEHGGFAGFEPIVTAILMPIPRAILPWKPNAEYIHEAENRQGMLGQGAAFLVFTEAYMSFGMIGVILYGLFIGWFCKRVWYNYRVNPNSIGALLFLSLLNGFCYQWISRGYMASAFNDFVYFVVLPFWLTALYNRFNRRKI